MKAKDVIKILLAAGWQLKNIESSHHHFIHPDRPGVKIQVPVHAGDIPKGTMHTIKKASGLKF